MITAAPIKSLALSLGFDVCGIAPVGPAPGEAEEFRRWISEGKHGTMKYLENFDERARNFWKNFPEARSIIVVGVNYYSSKGRHCEATAGSRSNQHRHSEEARRADKESQDLRSFGPPSADLRMTVPIASPQSETSGPAMTEDRPTGRVARYAWGQDYHRVIRKRLEEFRDRLNELVGRPTNVEICVDTKPLHERTVAQRAGLGFIGKQSQLLNPKFGPWLFLAELVTDLELEPDPPFIGSCGSCRICIDECPTEAIYPEGGIDARRCIAYLTIEHKGEIPEEFHPAIGDWVFGCDLCLEVCPFTSKAKQTGWPEFLSQSGFGERLDLVKLLEIPSNRAHQKIFAGTALARANRKQMRRNASIVLNKVPGT